MANENRKANCTLTSEESNELTQIITCLIDRRPSQISHARSWSALFGCSLPLTRVNDASHTQSSLLVIFFLFPLDITNLKKRKGYYVWIFQFY